MEDYISWRATHEALGISHVTLWRWVREKRFPKPVHLGPRRIAFIKSEVNAWEEERRNAR